MLQFLQTGKVLYVLAAVCALGIISKLVTGNLYKKINKRNRKHGADEEPESEGAEAEDGKYVPSEPWTCNPIAYIEKQVYGFRFMKISG